MGIVVNKTPEEMAEEWANQEVPQYHHIDCTPMDRYAHKKAERGFLAGYKAAENHFRDATEKVTYDYVETASNEAKELIAKFGLIDNEEVLVKALVAAYCRGVDAVDGYLRNSLSAYRASVKSQQWISVKDRLPEEGQDCLFYVNWIDVWDKGSERITYQEIGVFNGKDCFYHRAHTDLKKVSHWQPLPAPPKEEK